MTVRRMAIAAVLAAGMLLVSPVSQGSRLVFNQTGTVDKSIPYSGTIEINKVEYTLAKGAKIHSSNGTTNPADYGLDRGTTVGFTVTSEKGKRVIHDLWIVPSAHGQ